MTPECHISWDILWNLPGIVSGVFWRNAKPIENGFAHSANVSDCDSRQDSVQKSEAMPPFSQSP
jgi:hypothetical protein